LNRLTLLRRITFAVQVIAAVATIGIGVYTVNRWGGNNDYPAVIPLLLYSASPYFGLMLLTLLLSRTMVQAVLVLIGSVVLAAIGLMVLFDAFVVNPTALGGFLLIGVLIGQWFWVAMIGAAAGLDALIRWLLVRRQPTQSDRIRGDNREEE
jgi:hypothetical protein